MIILDTNVVSELLRLVPEQGVVDWLGAVDGADVYLTAITEAELRLGVAILPAGKRRDGLTEMIDHIIREDFSGRILPFDSHSAPAFAAIAASRRANRAAGSSSVSSHGSTATGDWQKISRPPSPLPKPSSTPHQSCCSSDAWHGQHDFRNRLSARITWASLS